MNLSELKKIFFGDAPDKDWKAGYLQTISEIEAHKARLDLEEWCFLADLKTQIENEVAVSRHQASVLNELWERGAA